MFNISFLHFNTSNVTIQPFLLLLFLPILHHFNTSNVTIQPGMISKLSYSVFYFNTSNVTIQRTFPRIQHTKKLISIHLMLLFNECNSVKQPALINISIHLMLLFNVVYSSYHCCTLDFNTSNVTIQPTILSHLFYSQFHYTHYISTFS